MFRTWGEQARSRRGRQVVAWRKRPRAVQGHDEFDTPRTGRERPRILKLVWLAEGSRRGEKDILGLQPRILIHRANN